MTRTDSHPLLAAILSYRRSRESETIVEGVGVNLSLSVFLTTLSQLKKSLNAGLQEPRRKRPKRDLLTAKSRTAL